MRVTKEDTLILLIDVQERLFPHIHNSTKLLERIQRFLKGAMIHNLPIVVSEQYVKGLGSTLPELQAILGDIYTPIEKMCFSCAESPEILDVLDNIDREFVVLLGIESHICVQQTAFDLIDEMYIPVILEDCVSSRFEEDKQTALWRMRGEDCIVTSSESLLFEITRTAEASEFKQISSLVK